MAGPLDDTFGVIRAREEADGEANGDRGSMLLEHIIAITVVFAVLLALLTTMGSAVAGITTGRQKTIATSLAKQAIEKLQGAYYQDIGMNLASAGLATDPLVSGTPPNLTFEGEPLVAVPAPVFPEYRSTVTDLGTTYTLKVFVTAVTPATGAPYRRLTVLAEWTPAQRGPTQQVRYSSLASAFDYTSFPAANALADVGGSSFTVTGNLGPLAVDDLAVHLPAARVTTSSSTLRTTDSAVAGTHGLIDVTAGPLTTSSCAVSGTTGDRAACAPATAEAVADNDAGSSTGPWATSTKTASATVVEHDEGLLSASLPGGDLLTASTTEACSACGPTAIGDDDGLPFGSAEAGTGGALVVEAANLGSLGISGELLRVGSGWRAAAAIDHDEAGGGRVGATASLEAPAVTLLDVAGAQPGYEGAARIGAFTASASAHAGSGTTAPVTVGDAITVQLWDALSPTGYTTVVVTPGVAVDVTTAGTVLVGATPVTVTTTLQAAAASTSTEGSNPRTTGKGQLPSLLTITVDVVVGGPEAGAFSLVLAYGSLTASAGWQVA